MSRMFGTDGVRGIANEDLTPELAFKLGQAGAMALTSDTDRPTILIGKDTRISGDMLEAALAAGVCSVGGDAVLLGVVPTPAVAYLTREYKADAGVVISASHNPVEYNGIKFFNCEGYKLPDETEDKIEAYIKGELGEIPRAIGGDVGRITYKMDAVEDYKAFAASTVSESFMGLKVAIDCANGASSCTAKDVLERLGAEVSVIHNNPDGTNINANCGSTHIESLIDFVKETGADLGLAFDGDADRVLAIDEKGELVDGDKIMSICGLDMKERGVLKDNTIVATVMSNLGLHIMAEKNGLKIEQTTVGDRYVLEKMIECDYKLGGEQSGHIILTDFNTTGDGLVTGLQLAAVLVRSGKKLSELASVMRVMPQVLINARVQGDKQAYKQDAEIMNMIAEIEKEFGGEGRVLIRPSGTEPLVRVMLEGNDIDRITERAKTLADLIQAKLG